jgi:hypothetical protein
VFAADVPLLAANQALPGTTATVTMTAGTPLPALIVMGDLQTPSIYELTGIYFNSVGTPIIAAIGIADPAGLQVQTLVPSTPALRGEIFCFQGVVWLPSGAPVLSGPGLWVLW